jgi:hypothetical protein
MAWLETVHLNRLRLDRKEGAIAWAAAGIPDESDFPQLCWQSGRPWREANQWLLSRLDDFKDIATVNSDARSLHAYAQWLEQAGMDWLHFPVRQRDRCLVRYRGMLMHAIDSNRLKPSTAATRMRVVVRFYRWLKEVGLIDKGTTLWKSAQKKKR